VAPSVTDRQGPDRANQVDQAEQADGAAQLRRHSRPAVTSNLAVGVVRRLWERGVSHDVQDQAAALAFRFFLALFPFCLFVAALGAVVARVLHTRSPVDEMLALLGDIPTYLTETVRRELAAVLEKEQPGLLSVGALATLAVAAHGMNALMRAMDRAYRVPETRPAWERVLVALGLTLLAGITVVTSFLFVVLTGDAGYRLAEFLGVSGAFEAGAVAMHALRWVLIPAMLVLVLSFLYRAAPNMPLRWKWVLPGAIFSTAGWLLCTAVFSFYVQRFGTYGATYGTLSGGAVLLIWLYVTALLLLLGAELNAYLDERINPAWIRAQRQQQLRQRQLQRHARLAKRLEAFRDIAPRWGQDRAA
jgi:membrane protein